MQIKTMVILAVCSFLVIGSTGCSETDPENITYDQARVLLELDQEDQLQLRFGEVRLEQVGAVDFRGYQGDSDVMIYLFEYEDAEQAIAFMANVTRTVERWGDLEHIHCVRHANMVMVVGVAPGQPSVALDIDSRRTIELYLNRFI